MKEGRVVKVAGPLVVASRLPNPKMYDLVKVGKDNLMGEIIELRGDRASIQVYEETSGIGPGDVVVTTGEPLSVELGPGLLTSIYDGVQRPLDVIREKYGNFISRGVEEPGLSRERKWSFQALLKVGDEVEPGDILGNVDETKVVKHRIMVPAGVAGKISRINEGEFGIEESIAVVRTQDGEVPVSMMQRWPVRKGRPYNNKKPPIEPLVTGQRIVDTFFPIIRGGTACVPGPFGSGKTVLQHAIAKWANSEIVVFVGCGERGNEMTDVLQEFPELLDPYSGEPLMLRTILIANTSNMPVAAREASVYTGITLAEYYRDMGYNVALQADSTSRWAEALREISGRLEEMPGEEGYPAYLGTRLAAFYERAGRVVCLGKDRREGSICAIGSVSPPGGDLSEPVTQATLRVVKVFWALEDRLAFARHFPAISWLNSYSLYLDEAEEYWGETIDSDYAPLREEAMAVLQREAELQEIVRLIGIEALSDNERLIMETAKSLREDFLQQNAFDNADAFTSLKKQFLMLKLIMKFHSLAAKELEKGKPVEELIGLPVQEAIAKAKFIPENELARFDSLEEEVAAQLAPQTSEVT
ncbi:MAG: V-type ATP synthase subunit A [Candidatus Solincola sediminis]|uniref:V-type ATP synthase alpha chain n=1 Tax=Candidatus Solincola sediminis TaxID=1797199 RepID=A0A1F2WGI7_9ACTN|nr:MAG: V-type ATP synthase subunit A [Candidatus Solincola sediminis]OFW56256.1 MAG: V-type ATP synthase subunit A [Candidatus Solincola sediminis]